MGGRGGRVPAHDARARTRTSTAGGCATRGASATSYVNAPTRLTRPARARRALRLRVRRVGWDEAIVAAVAALRDRRAAAACSPTRALTLEELFAARPPVRERSAAATSGTRRRVGADADGFLIVNEKGANQRGRRGARAGRARRRPPRRPSSCVERGDARAEGAARPAPTPVVAFATDGGRRARLGPGGVPAAHVGREGRPARQRGRDRAGDRPALPRRRARATCARPLDVLEEILLGLDPGREPLGREGAVARRPRAAARSRASPSPTLRLRRRARRAPWPRRASRTR